MYKLLISILFVNRLVSIYCVCFVKLFNEKLSMKLFEDLKLKFESASWGRHTEFVVIDTILEKHSDIFLLF